MTAQHTTHNKTKVKLTNNFGRQRFGVVLTPIERDGAAQHHKRAERAGAVHIRPHSVHEQFGFHFVGDVWLRRVGGQTTFDVAVCSAEG